MPTELQLKALRALPAVDEVLTTLSRSIPMEVFPHELVVDCIRKEVEAARTTILEDNTAQTEEEIANRTLRRLQAQAEPSLKQVINATGVILHTNLGRSALAPQAVAAVENAAKGYSHFGIRPYHHAARQQALPLRRVDLHPDWSRSSNCSQ